MTPRRHRVDGDTSQASAQPEVSTGAVLPPEAEDILSAESLSRGQLQTRAMHGAAVTSIMTILMVPLSVLANVIIARSLGAEEYGVLAVFTAMFVLSVQVANGGISSGVIQWGSAALATGDTRQADQLLRRSLGFHLLVELPILTIGTFILLRDQHVAWSVIVTLALAITLALGGGPLAVTIENRTDDAARMGFIANTVSLASTAAAAATTQAAAATWAARQIVGAVTLPLYLRSLSPARRRAVLVPLWPARWPPGLLRFSMLSCLAGLITALVISRSEIFLLGGLDSSEAVGLFALAYGLSYQVTAPVDALLNPLMPAVSGLLAGYKDDARRALLRALAFASLASSVVLALVVPSVLHLIPTLYGRDFMQVSQLFLALACISCLQSACHPVTAFVMARRAGNRLLANNAIALVVNLSVALPAILLFGVWGAVIANAAGQVALLGSFMRTEVMEQGLPWTALGRALRPMWLALLVALSLSVATLPLLATGADAVLVAVAVFVSSALLYSLLARLWRPFDDGDRRSLIPAMPGNLQPAARLALRVLLGPVNEELIQP